MGADRQVAAPKCPLQRLAAALQLSLFLLLPEVVPDLLPRTAGVSEREPVGTRSELRTAIGEYLDPVAGLQLVTKRHDLAVDAGSDAAVTDLGMYRVSEVDGGRAARQVVDVTGRREHQYALAQHVGLDRVDERSGGLAVVVHVEQLLHPPEAPLHFLRVLQPGLVSPVGSDAELSHTVHPRGADLHLDRLTLQPDHRRVQRLVAVRFRHGDVVLEPAGDRTPQVVDDAQCAVTDSLLHQVIIRVVTRADDDADRHQVEYLVKVLAVTHHPAVDAVQMLAAAAHLELEAFPGQPLLEQLQRIGKEGFPFHMPGPHLAFQHPVTLRLQVQERQVLKLVLDVTYAEPVRERREYLERLPADALLLVRRHRPQRTHVVQPVCQLHEDDAYIADHGQQHLPQVLRLLVLVHPDSELADLGLAFDDAAHGHAEFLLDLLEGDVGVLDGVVQQAGDKRVGIEVHLRQQGGHGHRMHDVGLTGPAPHAVMGFTGQLESLGETLLVGLAEVAGFGLEAVQQPVHTDL